jgi:hypothetical protein
MTSLVLYVNGDQHHSEPLTMDWTSTYGVTRAYETLFFSTGKHYDDRAHMICLEIFIRCFYMYSYIKPDVFIHTSEKCKQLG